MTLRSLPYMTRSPVIMNRLCKFHMSKHSRIGIGFFVLVIWVNSVLAVYIGICIFVELGMFCT